MRTQHESLDMLSKGRGLLGVGDFEGAVAYFDEVMSHDASSLMPSLVLTSTERPP